VLFFLGNWIPTFLIIGFIAMLNFCIKSQFIIFFIFLYLYFLPVFLYRIFNFLFPKKYGRCEIFSSRYNCWWYGVQFQTIYTRFPFLEEFLRIFPFVYSFWLRLWGAKIGRFIFWSPGVLIVDRGDLEIGDNCVIGYGAKFTSHLLTKTHKRNLLIYERITLKSNVVIGAEVNVGPGVTINSDVVIAALSTLLPFSEWKNSKEYNSKEI
jgi:acetyltransferase-like isoleucine patch superfamily enzyme